MVIIGRFGFGDLRCGESLLLVDEDNLGSGFVVVFAAMFFSDAVISVSVSMSSRPCSSSCLVSTSMSISSVLVSSGILNTDRGRLPWLFFGDVRCGPGPLDVNRTGVGEREGSFSFDAVFSSSSSSSSSEEVEWVSAMGMSRCGGGGGGGCCCSEAGFFMRRDCTRVCFLVCEGRACSVSSVGRKLEELTSTSSPRNLASATAPFRSSGTGA